MLYHHSAKDNHLDQVEGVVTTHTPKISFKGFVDNFYLPIGLRVIGCRFVKRNSLELKKFSPELTNKYGVPITCDG